MGLLLGEVDEREFFSMSAWRRILDRQRIRHVDLAEAGISGAWAMVHQLSPDQRQTCFELAGQAIARCQDSIDKPMMTGDIIWRLAYISDAGAIRREYLVHLSASRGFEEMDDIAQWILPTLMQFCYACEIARRAMWSKEGKERAYTVGRVASDKIGLLSLGRTPFR
jgi:hypothetical protein